MKRWVIVLLLVASAGVHWPGDRTDFVFDDDDFIVTNQSLRSLPAAFGAFGEPFPPDQVIRGLYRPMTNLSYAIDFSRGGLNPRPYHEANVLLYIGIVLLVFALARSYGLGDGTSGAAALLFSVHPAHCEAVDAISGRSELLSLGFALLCVIAFLHVVRASSEAAHAWPQRAIAIGGLVAYACACLSKETGVVLPGILAVHYALFASRDLGRAAFLRRGALLLAPYAVVLVAYLVLRVSVLEAFAPTISVFQSASWARQLHGMGLVYYLYAKLFLFPDVLQVDFYYRQFFGDPGATLIQSAVGWALAAGGLLLGAWLAWREWTRFPSSEESSTGRPGFGAIALVSLATTLAFFFPYSHVVAIGALMAERFLFAPSLGLILLLVVGVRAALQHRLANRAIYFAAWGLVLGLVLLGAERSHRRALEWRDDVALWRAAARDIPNDHQVHSNLASAHMDRGELEAARAPMRRALEIEPNEPMLRRNQLRLDQMIEGRRHTQPGRFE